MATEVWVEIPSISGSSAGVSSLNGETGAVTLVAGTGITITPAGQNITISSTSSGGTVTSVSVVSANGFAGTVATATTTPAITLSTTITGILKGNGTAISAAVAGTDYVIPSGSITGTASNITATSNSTLTTLSALSLPYSQVTGTPAALVFADSLVNTSGTITLKNDSASPTASQYYGTNASSVLGYYNLPTAGTGTVTSVALSTPGVLYTVSGSPVTTSGTLTLTLNTQTANTIFAGPTTGSAATPTFRALVSADIPTSLPALTSASTLSTVGTITTGVWNGTATSGTSFITSGVTYTTPASISTNTVFDFTLIGGGAGGASSNSSSEHSPAGGGGGGVRLIISGLTPSTAYTIAIGAGGAGGTSATVGTAGGNTTLTIGATTYTAGGGQPAAAISGVGGVGGTATNGILNIVGQQGGASMSVFTSGGLPGGNSPWGWGLGAAGNAPSAAANGQNATGYGGGGSGSSSNGAPTGGNGTQGIIAVRWDN